MHQAKTSDYFGTEKFKMTEFLKDMKPKKQKIKNEDSDDDDFGGQEATGDNRQADKEAVLVEADFEKLSKDQRRHMKYFKD